MDKEMDKAVCFANKRVLVIGAGISGMAALKLLQDKKAGLILFDGNAGLREEEVRKKLPENIQVSIYLGEMPEQVLDGVELAVVSPGVAMTNPLICKIIAKGIPLWGEIELAFAFEKGNVLAVTGTNGKTTTTALLGEIMQKAAEKVFVVGNIGIPYTGMVSETTKDSVTVAEISSFQLETVHDFKPAVAAVLNITPDHLDRHVDMENYAAAKERITANQTAAETCVLNYEDEYTYGFGKRTAAKVFYFSSKRELEAGIYCQDATIYLAKDGAGKELMPVRDIPLLGGHNVENVMTAMAMAYAYGVSEEIIIEAVKGFKGVEHRIEYVATKNEVDYYNDSKATNPDAAIKGVQAMIKPTLLIGGGYDKGVSFDEWIESFDGKVKELVLLGATANLIADCAIRHGFTNISFAESFEEAVMLCAEKAVPGDAVLLSPACASWGMFLNYEVRGKLFKEIVNRL